jgi:NAD+ kinase
MPEPVRRAAVVVHSRPETLDAAVERLRAVAAASGVELVFGHPEEGERFDIAAVLGGDGTMLRALRRFLGTTIPAVGVNFGTVGFLTAVPEAELEEGLTRVFAGDYVLVELATLEAQAGSDRIDAVNDVVAASSTLGRMVEISLSVGGESLGTRRCDGVICATPSGSTAYNLSSGGPVLAWGLDAMAVTFVAPHSLQARPLVLPRGREVLVRNETPDVSLTTLADGHPFSQLAPGETMLVRLGPQRTLLATLPETTFFTRYRRIFAG